jgi:parvulin-like peptidyl-prolyl isomerase
VLPLLTVLALAGCAGQAPAGTAAVVDGRPVPVASYDLLVSSAQRHVEASGPAVDWQSPPGRSKLREIQAQALRLAIRDVVVERMASQGGVSIGDAEIDQAIGSLESLAGGADQLDQQLELEGLTRPQYRTLLRDTLLDRELRARDTRYDAHLAAALRAASVQAYVGPCAADHQYPRCAR